ncbi:MAG: hypothetical protein IPP44_09850 [Ideonella sp.]|nr:hypothetical protein [Ideonella sp.]
MAAHKLLTALLFSAASSLALAAPVSYLTVDHSSATLMDKAGADAVFKAAVPQKLAARLAKLYPVGRFGFITQVEGGFTEAKTCVVTARAMLVPRSGKALVFTPRKSAMAFDAQANASQQQCKDLAAAKLKEAIDSVLSSLVATN